MVRYAVRAVPWTRLVLALLTLAALLAVVRGLAVDDVAAAGLRRRARCGGGAWCLDEPGAAVVDAAPRSLLWRTAGRAIGLGVVLAAWLALVWWSRGSLFGHAADVGLQGVSALVLVSAGVTWARSGGSSMPGTTAAAVVVPTAAFLGLARPFAAAVPIFPYGPDDDWALSRGLWAALLALGIVVAVAALADVRWRRVRSLGVSPRDQLVFRRAGR